MIKKTKNYIDYKKTYFTTPNKEKFAPFRVEISVYNVGYKSDTEQKIVELAKRNSGEETWSRYGDFNFNFYTEKGLKQFTKKVHERYTHRLAQFKSYQAEVLYKEIDD